MSNGHLTRSDVLVLVPAFNEEKSVSLVLNNLRSSGYHTVLISDGSHDSTAAMGRSIGVDVLEIPVNLGVGGALRTGFRFAVKQGFAAVIQVDADGQHPVEHIDDLISAANSSSAHMVIGSRFLDDGTTMAVDGIRRLAMQVLSISASRAARKRITDSTSGFRLVSQPLLGQFAQQFATNFLGDTYEAVISAGRAGYKIVEIPAPLKPREFGESTASTGSALGFTLKGLGVAFLGLHKRIAPAPSSG